MKISRWAAVAGAAALLALAVLACGCGGGGGGGGGGAPGEYTDPSVPIKAKVGDEFVIRLGSNATTGYGWTLSEEMDAAVVELVGSEYVAPQEPMPGAPGEELWTFKAVGKGSASITLDYGRPFEPDQPPADSRTFEVEVD